jgi:hypothetical protein
MKRLVCLLMLVPAVALGEVSVSTTYMTSEIDLEWPGHEITGIELVEFSGQSVELRAVDDGTEHVVRLLVKDGIVRLVFDGTTPDDPPDDPPDEPGVGHLGLTKKTFEWVGELVDESKDPDKVEHAKAQGVNYLNVAKGLVKVPPKWETVSEAFAALKLANQEAVPFGEVRDAWAAFGLRVTTTVSEIWDSEPFDREEASRILAAIGNGLMWYVTWGGRVE